MENSFHSRGSKNFVLKSDYLNTSKHNSKKNLSFYDNNNGQNQKSLFRTSQSFIDQEEEDNKRERLKSINTSNKESESNFFNNIIFNDLTENTNWNKPKSNHSNIIQEYYQNIDDNIELFNNQFSNMNLYNNETNEPNNFGSFNINEKNNIENNNNNINSLNNNSNNLGIKTNSPNYVNNIQGEFINNKNINEANNNIDKNNFVNINSGLNNPNPNDFKNQLIVNSLIDNNNSNPHYFSSSLRNSLQNNNNTFNNSKSDIMLKKKKIISLIIVSLYAKSKWEVDFSKKDRRRPIISIYSYI